MGSVLGRHFKEKPVRVFFQGLHSAGKTTLMYQLKLGEVVEAFPTVGLDIQELKINGTKIHAFEAGSRCGGRSEIGHFLKRVDAVLFFVDSSDRDRLQEAVSEFFEVLYPQVQERQIPVAVLANKQDKPEVVSLEEITKAFYDKGGEEFRVNTAVEIFPIAALTFEGVTPAMDWLTSQLALRMARDSYVTPCWSKVKNSPASIVKSAFNRVVRIGRSSVPKDEKSVKEKTEVGK